MDTGYCRMRKGDMVTVIIPLYNAESTIIRALDSLRGQTAVEKIKRIIVVNDGSKDGGSERVKEYMEQYPSLPITYIEQSNQGAAAARNKGMRMADTKYIAFLDADDLWLPNKLERQLQIIKENPQIRFLGTTWQEKPFRIGWKKIPPLYNGSIQDLCIRNFPVTPSIIMEASLCQEIGYFDESRRYAEDINYFQKIAVKGNYYLLSEKLVEIDVGKDFFAQNGLSANLYQMHKGTLKNIRELKDDGTISVRFWLFMRVFYEMKYWRRVILRVGRTWFKGGKK